MSKQNLKKLKGKYEVTQSNELVEARYKSEPLTLQEQRLVLAMVSMVEPADTELYSIKMRLKQFCELVGMESTTNYSYIKKVCRELRKKDIEIQKGKEEIITGWVSEVVINKYDGLVEFIIPEKIKPFLVNLNDTFTRFKLEDILQLKTSYGFRFYQLVMKWAGTKEKKFKYELDELRKMLGANKKSYNLYGDFKRKVLLPAIDDLKNNAKVVVEFEEIKYGRKVVAIKFTIKQIPSLPKKKKEKTNEEEILKLPLRNRDKEVDDLLNMFSRTEKD